MHAGSRLALSRAMSSSWVSFQSGNSSSISFSRRAFMGSLSTSRYPFRVRFLETRDIPQPRCPQMSSSPSPRTDKAADGNSHHRQHRGRTGLHPGAYSRAWQGVGYGNSPSQCTITGSGRFRLFHAFGERSRQSWRSESARAPRLCHIATSPLSSRWRSSKGSGTNNLPSAKRPLICVRSRAPRR